MILWSFFFAKKKKSLGTPGKSSDKERLPLSKIKLIVRYLSRLQSLSLKLKRGCAQYTLSKTSAPEKCIKYLALKRHGFIFIKSSIAESFINNKT